MEGFTLTTTTAGPAKPTLNRTTFRQSRLLDFCSDKELVAQTGHQQDDWPLVAIKELIDNAADACEDAGIAPEIIVTVDDTGITVVDNGPGIPESVIEGVLDFSIRVSSREAYVSPTRGAQGNALKTIVVMPFVMDGTQGRVDIEAHGVRHEITLRVDRIRQTPVSDHVRMKSDVKKGTRVRIHWPDSARSNLDHAKPRFLQIATDYTIVNPHLSLSVDWRGEKQQYAATDPAWSKWKPSDPTSPHWYRHDHLERLIAGYIAHDADVGRAPRTVREFVSEFRGLSGSAKQKLVLETSGFARTTLADLATAGEIDKPAIVKLLAAMRENSKPVKPMALGIIGETHLRSRFNSIDCAMETFSYRKTCGVTDALPWAIEVAFAAYTEAIKQTRVPRRRRLVTGVNWSPGIINPFRELGAVGESLDSLLSEQRAGADEPVMMVLHLACPRVEYLDRGKSSIVIHRTAADTEGGDE